jgi:predicted dehydrogenase
MAHRQTRRDFLKTTAAGAGVFALAGLTPKVSRAASERIRIAGIGVGGKGHSDILQAGNHGDIVAICDIDENHLAAALKDLSEPKDTNAPKHSPAKYSDYRKMLEEMGKSIDAVTVSTPDHTHAPAALMAMKMGKHVYCQKPLCHDVAEARALRETAKDKKLCTQMGNQGTASNGLRRAVEIIRAGVIGPVTEVHVWTNRPIWPQAPKVTKRPEGKFDIPKTVHWDLFLGTAPERPYAPGYHPFAWRGWWDFGTGALGDMACHTANMAFMALKLGYPKTIVAEAGDVNKETCPSFARITFEFPAREGMPALKFYWYEGKKDDKKVLPPEELTKGLKLSDSGSLLVGEKAILFSPNDYGEQYTFEGKDAGDINAEAKKVPVTLPRNGKGDDGMKAEWVEAIRNGKPEIAMSNFDYAAMLTETILLGNVAIRTGKKLEWDGPNMKVTNCPDAAQYIKRTYRKGWEL